MFNETSGLWKAVLSVLFFPLLFQNGFIDFAWGAGDTFWVMTGKRVFALLPVMAIILGCWVSIACLLTVLVRQNRREFLTGMLITWWDLGKSIVYFWGGILKFLLNLAVALIELGKIVILGLLSLLQEAIYTPFRLLRSVSRNVLSSPVPWIAVFMTVFWCIIEAVIFTYVTTPLVVDVFSNITGENLNIYFIRIPLFLFLLFVIMGSYAVLSTFVDSFKKKNLSTIAGIGVIEVVVLFVEVVFLYREFVDSLVPWFAQYSENFELGIIGTLAIACFVWFGIRSLSWFLFASHGTPTILYLIQGKGIVVFNQSELKGSYLRSISPEFMEKIKAEVAWMKDKGEELLSSLMLPPLQVVAAGVNFCTMLLISKHLFELPFKSISAIANSKALLRKIDDSRPVTVENNKKPREHENVQV
ncbi:MAG: hypothetical protein JSW64_00125 [Candidatus Zixiibacteriota bacterium]|nr:MAG: hypothetical protein JSW64_00125 [candidate division Zixibacteria bacterium]